MPLILQSRIYRADLRANPTVLYVFGDNPQRMGLGGQAGEMRGEPNSIGVVTCSLDTPWTDADAEHQCALIDSDMAPLFQALLAGWTVVYPLDGIGTGIADLANRSPKTWAHLMTRLAELRAIK
jgi:hypothetical protein